MSSIKDVAAEANVSQSTVSKVLNNRSDANISVATRDRVRMAAHRIGYHPSALARGLAGKQMNTFGVVMAYSQASVTSDPYLGPCLDGILDYSKQHRQKVTLFLEDDWPSAIEHLPVYGDGQSDGLLIIIPRTNSAFVRFLQEIHPRLPFVLVGESAENSPFACVDLDNIRTGYEATQHLIRLGHRRIAAFCGNHDFSSNTQRLQGYRQAMTEAGLPVDPDLIFSGEYHPESGEQNAHLLVNGFSPRERPTGIFCLCDAIAVGALEALREKGISVPKEISVIGVDDIPRAEKLGLTTQRQSIRQIGLQAAQVLYQRVRNLVEPGHRTLLSSQLIVRSSTAPYVQ